MDVKINAGKMKVVQSFAISKASLRVVGVDWRKLTVHLSGPVIEYAPEIARVSEKFS